LADEGFNTGTLSQSVAVGYPIPVGRSIVNLAVHIPTVFVGGTQATVVLLQNGVAVPGFTLTFLVAGTQVAVAGPTAFNPGDTLDIRVTGSGAIQLFSVSAMVGVA
jgi:protein involved in polysaccharide export with SLBB domain